VWVIEHGYPAEPADQSDPAFRGGEPAQAAFLTESVLALAEASAGEVFVTLRDNLDGASASEGRANEGWRTAEPSSRSPTSPRRSQGSATAVDRTLCGTPVVTRLRASYLDAHRYDGATIQHDRRKRLMPDTTQPRDLALLADVRRHNFLTRNC
jgi:hypothetical protein